MLGGDRVLGPIVLFDVVMCCYVRFFAGCKLFKFVKCCNMYYYFNILSTRLCNILMIYE